MDDPHGKTAQICELVAELLMCRVQNSDRESQNIRRKGRVNVSYGLNDRRAHLHRLGVLLRLSVSLGDHENLLYELALFAYQILFHARRGLLEQTLQALQLRYHWVLQKLLYNRSVRWYGASERRVCLQ